MSFHMKQTLQQITDRSLLQSALTTLQYLVAEHEQPVPVRGYGNELLDTRCELVISRETSGLGADIGFHQEQDGSFTLVSDSYAVENLDEIMASVKRTYEEEKAIATAQAMGYRVASRGTWIQQGEQEWLQLRLTQ
jgi:hypothetical protein